MFIALSSPVLSADEIKRIERNAQKTGRKREKEREAKKKGKGSRIDRLICASMEAPDSPRKSSSERS